MPRLRRALPLALICALAPAGCAGDDPLDGENAPFPSGKADGGIDEGSAEALAVLALVNDPAVGVAELDDDARLHARAAENIIEHRDGADGQAGTGDDNPFGDLAELDQVPFVGPSALEALLAYAIAEGYLIAGGEASAIFSPQPDGSAHTDRIAELIGEAEHTIDIAMYSYSDAAIGDALEDAVARGVKVRFIFETASDDRKLNGSALVNSKSGRLEQTGINVRWVNKIMHHKFAIIDGPRDEAERAATGILASGSANWSFGGGHIYDENTLFISGQPELLARFQAEFDHMWNHSRDVVIDASLPFEMATADLSTVRDSLSVDVYLTSANFDVSAGGDTFRVDRESLAVADAWVAAIESADTSIHLASGHLRLRPVAEALIAKAEANPDMDIRVYLDQQEYISAGGDSFQQSAVEDCLAEATTELQEFDCENKSFLWGRQVGLSGAEVRYKSYSYRWDFTYAEQMHHKYMIIDGDELLSGSYNLSINAEHNTFENTMHLRGPAFAALIAAYEANFESIWDSGRDLLAPLQDKIATADPLPIVFDSMALSWDEYTDLRDLIRDNCSQIDSDEFRQNPAQHRDCDR